MASGSVADTAAEAFLVGQIVEPPVIFGDSRSPVLPRGAFVGSPRRSLSSSARQRSRQP